MPLCKEPCHAAICDSCPAESLELHVRTPYHEAIGKTVADGVIYPGSVERCTKEARIYELLQAALASIPDGSVELRDACCRYESALPWFVMPAICMIRPSSTESMCIRESFSRSRLILPQSPRVDFSYVHTPFERDSVDVRWRCQSRLPSMARTRATIPTHNQVCA